MAATKNSKDKAYEDYNSIIGEMNALTVQHVFSKLPRDNSELFKLLLHSFIIKLVSISDDNSNELVKHLNLVLESLKSAENTVSVLFLLLENLTAKKDEVSRIAVLEILRKQEFSIINIINLLYKNDTENVVVDILKNKCELVDEFIRESIKIENPNVFKNLSMILPALNVKYFINYKSFAFLFERENHHLRNCFIDIIEMLILHFKEESNLEAIVELTGYVSERLYDVNFYVRNKALACIGSLFKNEAILKDQRNAIIKEVMERTKDKTVIVRKKSINLLGQILFNHPFKNKDTLERDLSPGKEIAGRIEADFDEFTGLMEESLGLIVSLLDYNLKTDILEISNFIKIAYLLKINGSKQAIHKILSIVFTKEKQVIIDIFKEILLKRGEILYEFINDKAFEVILSYLDVDEKLIFKNIYNGHKVFESIYVLKQIKRPISEQNALSLLQHVTGILFSSKDEADLEVNVKCYLSMLCIIRNLKYRIEYNHDILNLAIKNVVKMVFFERSLIKFTVELIYFVSNNPEKTIERLVKNLCLSKSTLKIVDSIGWIALNQFYLLERLEKKFKKSGFEAKKIENGELISGGMREKRKSLEESRRSSLGRMSIDRNERYCDGFKLSLRLDELEENLKSKTDEEIADFFFYLKEKEVLYSSTSMLHQFIPVLKRSLLSENQEIQIVAYSSMFKCMLISSEFFEEHYSILLESLDHPNLAVKNTTLVALHDFIIFYNSSVDSEILFNKLQDPEVSKNALLIIFNLLQKNIIRIKNNSVKVASLIFDEDLGNIVKTMIKSFSSNNNIISTIFYEVYLSSLNSEYVKFLSSFVNPSIQESLFLKCLKNNVSSEKLKAVYELFELNEKFIKDNIFRLEMKDLVGDKIIAK